MNLSSNLFLILSLLLFSSLSLAQSKLDGIAAINANSMSRDTVARTIVLKGDIQVVFKGQYIKADKATIYLKKKEIHASGNVVIKTQTSHAEADRIVYNYDDSTGVLYNAFVQAGQVVFEGSVIKKSGKNEYVASKAKYTACTTCPPAWSFSGQEIEAEIGGYAYIKYPVLRIGDVPILFLPAILVPLKSARQSGFLVPTLDFSSAGGAAIAQSYFWAIDRSSDATFTAKRYEKRGWQGLFDYRYVLTKDSRGQIKGGFIGDKRFSADNEPDKDTEELNRGFATYKHYYKLPNDWVQRANLNYSSDLRYTRDFSDQLPGHKDPALGNRVSLTKNTEYQHFSAETEFYINLLQEDALANNDNAVHRMPEIRYTLSETELLNTNFHFGLELNYVNFARRDYGYDDISQSAAECDVFGSSDPPARCVNFGAGATDTTGDQARDGVFNSGDQIRAGQRLDVVPKVTFPFHIGNVDILPSVAYNETAYHFNVPQMSGPSSNPGYEQTAHRAYVQTDVSLRGRLGRVFGANDKNIKATKYKHDIIPEVTLSRRHFVARPDSDHPFFGDISDEPYSRFDDNVTNDDFTNLTGARKLQFDYRDRVFDQNIVNFAFTNHIIRKLWRGNTPQYKKIVTLRLAQSFDFLEDRRNSQTRWSTVKGLLSFNFDSFDSHTTAEYYPYARVSDIFSRVRLKSKRGDFIELSFTQDEDVVDENEALSDSRDTTWGLGVGFVSRFVNLSGRTEYDAQTEKLDSWKYTAQFKPPGDCWGVQFSQKKVAGADDVVTKFDFSFDFGGDAKKTFF